MTPSRVPRTVAALAWLEVRLRPLLVLPPVHHPRRDLARPNRWEET